MINWKCQTCLWFDKVHDTLKTVPSNFGYCRKHKPVIYQYEKHYYGGWPLVDINDLCGEWRKDE